MSDLISYVIRGIPFGCIFSLIAVGLVLSYDAGVVNLFESLRRAVMP